MIVDDRCNVAGYYKLKVATIVDDCRRSYVPTIVASTIRRRSYVTQIIL